MLMNVSTIEKSALTSALAFASLGYRVLPCHSVINGICTCGGRSGCKPGKHPLTPHGLKDATTDIAIITAWWEQWPFANVAIATGGSFWVEDVDPRHGGDTTMTNLVAQNGAIPPTPTVATGGGGIQHYLRYPPDVVIRSRSGVAEGIDVRGDGGYVIAPPSMHQSGVRYEWLTPLDIPLADAPAWLLAMVAQTPTAKPELNALANTSGGIVLTMGSAEPGDFTTHAGEEEGKRNDTLCRLVGVHLRRGDSPATVEALALAWAQRCEPPLPEDQVFRVLRWGEGKRALNMSEDDSPDRASVISFAEETSSDSPTLSTHNQSLSQPSDGADSNGGDWPTLHADAYHGLAGDIIRAIEPETEADPVGILLTLLTFVGNAIGRTPYFVAGADTHHANLFATIVGNTASRKGAGLSVVKWLMQRAEPEWYGNHLGYGLSSGEGLIERVRDEEPAEGTFAIPEAKRLLCIEPEFVRLLQVKGREGNTLNANIRNAWDGAPIESMTRTKKGEPRNRATSHHVSILGHITPKEHAKAMVGSIDLSNGFCNRFLWALVRRARYLPEGGDINVLEPFVEPIREAIAKAKTIGRVVRDDECKTLWASVYADLSSADEESLARAEPQTLRLSLIYAILDCSNVIRAEHLRAALAVWAYCEASAKRIFGGSEKQGQFLGGQPQKTVPMPLHTRLLDAIAKTPGISRRGLHEATGNRIMADDMEAALAILEAQRLAHRRLCQSEGGGRPAECWWPGLGDNPSDDDPSDHDRDTGKGVILTMGGGDPVVTGSASASTQAHGSAVSLGRPASASPPEEIHGDETGLRSKEQTPAPAPATEIISSQSFFAGGIAAGGGVPPSPEDQKPQSLSPLEADPKSRFDKKPTYAVGQYVRTTLLGTPLKVIEVTVYAPTAQYYVLAHDDPKWEPPKDCKLSINTNFDRPRVCVTLSEIIGSAPPPTAPSTGSSSASTRADAANEPVQDIEVGADRKTVDDGSIARIEAESEVGLPPHRSELDSREAMPLPAPVDGDSVPGTVPPDTPVPRNNQAQQAAEPSHRCVKCGDAVVGLCDEYCHPCFVAEIQSLSPEQE
jgi:Bifunctional DNA primase/polymerase, N-terminal/Primase C terminal 1 (PriCT-1)/Protein of unknown function (DUF3987)